jgi:hypothetical protein
MQVGKEKKIINEKKKLMNSEQAKIDIYLSQPEVKMALDMLSLRYDFVVDELAKSILQEELVANQAVDFLVAEFDFNQDKATELVDKLSENVVEPFYVEDAPLEEASDSDEEETVTIHMEDKKINWRHFIRPKVLQLGMEELNKASSGDVARVRNYLWKHLGLNKPEEVVIVLCWLATTGELVSLWQEDSRFRGILKKYISIHHSEELAENIMAKNVSPALFAAALQMTLKEKLNLSASDSAMIAMSIIDRMPDEDKPKYILSAFVDEKDNSFNWNQIQESAQGLSLAM